MLITLQILLGNELEKYTFKNFEYQKKKKYRHFLKIKFL